MRALLAFLLTLYALPALAWIHGSGSGGVTACPYVASAGSDGCGSNISLDAATPQSPTFFNSGTHAGYASQTGQSYIDQTFTASISGTTLTVPSAPNLTTCTAINCTISDDSGLVAKGTYIVANIDSTRWTVSKSQTVASETMASVRRPAHNVAGVDYHIGAYGSTFVDPYSIAANTTCTDPGSGNRAWICPTSSPNGGPVLHIYAGGASTYTVSNLNLSAVGGHKCTIIVLENGSTKDIILDNLNIANEYTCTANVTAAAPGSVVTNQFIAARLPGSAFPVNVTVSHVSYEGHSSWTDDCGSGTAGYCTIVGYGQSGATTTNMGSGKFNLIGNIEFSTKKLTVEYAYGHNMPSEKVINSGGASDAAHMGEEDEYFNFFDTFLTRVPQGHGGCTNLSFIDLVDHGYETCFAATSGSAPKTAIDSTSQQTTTGTTYHIHDGVYVSNTVGGVSVLGESCSYTMASGIITITSCPHAVPGGIVLTSGYNTGLGTQLSGSTFQADCSSSGSPTGEGANECPGATSSGGYSNNTVGNGTSTSITMAYYQGASLYSPLHAASATSIIQNNFGDATGTSGNTFWSSPASCAASTFSGNVSLTDGSAQNAWSPAGRGAGC